MIISTPLCNDIVNKLNKSNRTSKSRSSRFGISSNKDSKSKSGTGSSKYRHKNYSSRKLSDKSSVSKGTLYSLNSESHDSDNLLQNKTID